MPSSAAGSSSHAGGPARGRWLIFGASFFWGTSATLARFVFRDRHVPPLTVVELRLVLAALALGLWLVWRKPQLLRVERRDWLHFLVLGLFGLAAVQGSYYYSISVLGVGVAIVIQYLAPSLIVALHLARGGRVDAPTAGAVVAALTGTALLVGNFNPATIAATPLQWAISFGSALSFAFYIVYSKRRLARYAPATVLFYTFVVAGIFWGVVTPPWKILAAGYPGSLWLLFFLLALFSTLVPFSLFYAGLRRLTATHVGVLATLEPVVAVVSAAVALGERFRPLQSLGALLILVAAAVSSSRTDESAPPQVPGPAL